ncbi:hypothetical protein BOQ62_10085 [Chryseobacterium sp. CH21]|nr:hypothetical protein BOQ62_10085 [Chryseobacterium sp. CH21]
MSNIKCPLFADDLQDTNPYAKEYNELLAYDVNGNILNLVRTQGLLSGSNTTLMIDNLKYDYIGNKLVKVTDEQQNSSGYPYSLTPNTIGYDNDNGDGNGNMISQPDKGILSIQYNYLNLPKQITQSSKITQYTYRADGVKVKKLFGDLETDYLDGFQYKSTKPSESSPGGIGVIDDPDEPAEIKLRIIPTSEGYYDALLNQYIYNYTDHLGNVRLSYTDTNKDGVIQPRQYFQSQCEDIPWDPFNPPSCISTWKPGEIVEVNNYYPFGMLHNYINTTQNAYQYKYNGKELQETGMYDYGARFYMPDIGRWGVIDPLAETSRRWSTYTYAYNNPLRFIDPDGMQNYDITFGKSVSADTQNKIVSDLEKETGLKLSVGDNGKLSYKESSDMGGSKTARDMLKGAIDNHRTDYQINSDNTRGSSIQEIQGRGEKVDGVAGYTHVYDLNINTDQIDGFINGASQSLNPLTLGYGMTTLHEVSHKYNNLIDGIIGDDGKEYSATSIYGMQGDNEKKVINVIRTELDNSGGFKLPFGQRKSYSPMDTGGINFSAFSNEAYSKGPLKVDPKKDLYIKTPRK